MPSYTDAAWIWNASMQFISSEAITLKIEIAWWSRAIHCDMQPPQKNPRWLRLRTHTHTDCSVLLMSAYLSPVNANPPASYKPLFLFKHHLHPLCLLQTLPLNPRFPHSVTSYRGQHGETQNYLQSFWPFFDSGLIQSLRRWGRRRWGRTRQQRASMQPECMNAAHLLHYLFCLPPFHKSDWWHSSSGHETCKIMHSAKTDK